MNFIGKKKVLTGVLWTMTLVLGGAKIASASSRAWVTIITNPPNACVKLDSDACSNGKVQGKWIFGAEKNQFKVQPGKHFVEVSMPRYVGVVRVFSVEASEHKILNISLQKDTESLIGTYYRKRVNSQPPNNESYLVLEASHKYTQFFPKGELKCKYLAVLGRGFETEAREERISRGHWSLDGSVFVFKRDSLTGPVPFVYVVYRNVLFKDLMPEHLNEKGFRLHLIKWGRRRYVIPDLLMRDFVRALATGQEPRSKKHGYFFLREKDASIAVSDYPLLPKQYRQLFVDWVVLKNAVPYSGKEETRIRSHNAQDRSERYQLHADSLHGEDLGLERMLFYDSRLGFAP